MHHLDIDDGAEEAKEVGLEHDWNRRLLYDDKHGKEGSTETPEHHHQLGKPFCVLGSIVVDDLWEQLDAPADRTDCG